MTEMIGWLVGVLGVVWLITRTILIGLDKDAVNRAEEREHELSMLRESKAK